MAALGAGAAVAVAWAGAATFWILNRDEIALRVIAHETELRFAYEDRIAGLKGQLEREVTQNLVERTQVDRRVDALARRQAEIEARHGWLRRLAERTAPGERPPAPPAATEAGELRLKRGGEAGEPPRDRLSVLERSLDGIAKEETAVVETFRRAAQTRLARVRAAVAVAGLDPDRFADPSAAAQGGPLIPLPPAASPLAPVAAETEARLAELTRLQGAARAMPLARPVAGDLDQTSGFGVRLDPFTRTPALHGGVDFRAEPGTPVRATGAGKVAEAEWSGGYGLMVEIDHGGGVTTRYGHLSGIAVAAGARVEAGQTVGRVGSTGRSTGPHLHYEVRVNGDAVNPQRFLEAGRLLAAAE